MSEAQKNQADADDDRPSQEKLSGAESVNEESHDRRKDAHFEPTEACGKRNLSVAPAELLLDGFKESGEAEKDDAAHIEIDDETGKNDPPSVI